MAPRPWRPSNGTHGGTQQWHPSNGTQQWHPAMAPSNGTQQWIAPSCLPQSPTKISLLDAPLRWTCADVINPGCRRRKPPLMQITLLAVAKNPSTVAKNHPGTVAKNPQHRPSQKKTQPTHRRKKPPLPTQKTRSPGVFTNQVPNFCRQMMRRRCCRPSKLDLKKIQGYQRWRFTGQELDVLNGKNEGIFVFFY